MGLVQAGGICPRMSIVVITSVPTVGHDFAWHRNFFRCPFLSLVLAKRRWVLSGGRCFLLDRDQHSRDDVHTVRPLGTVADNTVDGHRMQRRSPGPKCASALDSSGILKEREREREREKRERAVCRYPIY